MSQIRYEEYKGGEGKLPFAIYPDLVRTGKERSDKANFHEEYELQICHRGEGYALVGGVRYDIKAGDILAIHPNEIHYTGSESSITYTALIFDGALFEQLSIGTTPSYQTLFSDKQIEAAIQSIKELVFCEGPLYVAKCVRALVDIAIAMEGHRQPGQRQIDSGGTQSLVLRALKYIQLHYAEKISLQSIADALYCDKFALAHATKQQTGESIHTHLSRKRMQAAAQLLSQGFSVAEVARSVGFENLSFFTRVFKAQTGTLPSAYRKQGGGHSGGN